MWRYLLLKLETIANSRVKEAILRRQVITDESYRQRFRLGTEINLIASWWQDGMIYLKERRSHEEVVDQIILEHFLKTLPDNVIVFVRERIVLQEPNLEVITLPKDFT